MKIIVNGRCLSRPITGVERYAREILICLEGQVRVVQPAREVQGFHGHLWEQFILPRHIHSGEVLWSPANTGALLPANQALTLHDLSALEHPDWYSATFGLWYRLFLPVLVRRVKRVVASSNYVRRKIISRFRLPPEKVCAAPGGVDLKRFHPRQQVGRSLPARYVLFVGSHQPRKNLNLLLDAWAMIEHRYPDTWLIIAGTHERNFGRVDFPTITTRIHFPGYVPEAELPSLYAGAKAFVLPSLDEGFGLPVLEAMACGAPVIASSAGALPEVLGDAGYLFDPLQPADLAEALVRILGDEELSRGLVEKGLERVREFPWQRSADTMQEVLRSCR